MSGVTMCVTMSGVSGSGGAATKKKKQPDRGDSFLALRPPRDVPRKTTGAASRACRRETVATDSLWKTQQRISRHVSRRSPPPPSPAPSPPPPPAPPASRSPPLLPPAPTPAPLSVESRFALVLACGRAPQVSSVSLHP